MYPLEHFTNLDCNLKIPADIHAKVPPLPFADESLHDIYCGHCLEHLTRPDAVVFLDECYRCLVPGGRIGIVVPDIREVMRRYLAGDTDCVMLTPGVWRSLSDMDDLAYMFLYGCNNGEEGHRWAYDKDTLARIMQQSGFVALREIDRYRDERLGSGAWFQTGIDGRKPKKARATADGS
jgi:predicted SAM-dependent methyltransferase